MTVTVLSGPERRRRWTIAEKLRIVEESLASDAVASEVARRHDVHPNQLHAWRRMARLGLLIAAPLAAEADENGPAFVPVAVAPESFRSSPLKAAAAPPAVIDLVLRNGRILRLPESVPPGRVAALADALEGVAR